MARQVLGQKGGMSPVGVIGKNGELTSNPQSMATEFNKFFTNKVSKLGEEAQFKARADPTAYLGNWLATRGPVSTMSFTPLTKPQFRNLVKQVVTTEADHLFILLV